MPSPFDLDDDDVGSPAPMPGVRPANFVPAPPPPPPPMPWLDALNPEQRQAVETTEGPVLVLSGAGTGKTRVLTSRLGYILQTGKARPWQCLAVTFTNKAAREMSMRVAGLVGPAAAQMWLGTFHALAARIVRRHAELVGLQSNFTILDSDDQIRLIKQLAQAASIDPKKWPAQLLLGVIQRWKDRGQIPSQVNPQEVSDLAGGQMVALYRTYQERLRALNCCDFGDLTLHCLEIFRNPDHRDVLEAYQDQFRYILVDEYQDTNVGQYLWLRLLAQKHRNLCVVGDDDQSVYSWRGAEVGNILRFERDFPGATVVRLEANYRSTPSILAAASHLIANNKDRLGKTLRPGDAAAPQGEDVVVRGLWDGAEEATWVVEQIESLRRDGIKLGQIAILVRASFQTRVFEERLVATGMPYTVVGGLRFYERQEIRDAIAYFRVVVQPADDLAFERVVNLPKRGLGEAALQTIHMLARQRGMPLTEAARVLATTDELTPKQRQALGNLLADFARWRALLTVKPHVELARMIIDESGYLPMWRQQSTPDAQGRVENLKELLGGLEEFESLPGFLEHVSLVMENDETAAKDRVVLMTLHAAKGLEFDAVFLPGWEEGLFPHPRALEESGLKGLEEERRLAYVGLTRARYRAFVSHVANRLIYNQWQASLPSRFIGELPDAVVRREAEHGLFGGMAEPAARWQGATYGTGGGTKTFRKDEPQQRRIPDAKKSTFKTGDRVFHQKFGYGRVSAIDGDRLDIEFEHSGAKKVLDSFIALA